MGFRILFAEKANQLGHICTRNKNPLTNIDLSHIIHIDDCLLEANTLQSVEQRTAAIFKALCDENRIRILKLLQSGEKCACVLLDDLQITQPTLSHHMKILCDSDIVMGRKDGKWTHYSISPEGAAYAVKCLQELTKVTCTDENKSCCEK